MVATRPRDVSGSGIIAATAATLRRVSDPRPKLRKCQRIVHELGVEDAFADMLKAILLRRRPPIDIGLALPEGGSIDG